MERIVSSIGRERQTAMRHADTRTDRDFRKTFVSR